MKKSFLQKRSSGFTLIETLVAVSIFSVSILGLLVILTQGLANTGYAKRKMVASYLAQEGIEYVRNLRDTYVLYGSDSQVEWINFQNKLSGGSCMNTNGCYFNDSAVVFADNTQPILDLAFGACTSATCANAPLLYNSTNGKYGYSSGSNSGFYRQIKVETTSLDEFKITSIVHWSQPSGNHSITLSESLYNWAE